MFDIIGLLQGNGIFALIAALVAAYIAWRNKDAIKQKLFGTETSVGSNVTTDETGLAITHLISELKKGLFTSDLVRGACSHLCRKMIAVAEKLPNSDSAKKSSKALRDLFVEFGVPTSADATPEVEV